MGFLLSGFVKVVSLREWNQDFAHAARARRRLVLISREVSAFFSRTSSPTSSQLDRAGFSRW
jgi:hypothetical protein